MLFAPPFLIVGWLFVQQALSSRSESSDILGLVALVCAVAIGASGFWLTPIRPPLRTLLVIPYVVIMSIVSWLLLAGLGCSRFLRGCI